MALIIFKIMMCLITTIFFTILIGMFLQLFDLDVKCEIIILVIAFIIIFITLLSGTFAGIFM